MFMSDRGGLKYFSLEAQNITTHLESNQMKQLSEEDLVNVSGDDGEFKVIISKPATQRFNQQAHQFMAHRGDQGGNSDDEDEIDDEQS